MAAKKVQKQITLHMLAGKATPAPPVGPILGWLWINIGQVIKEFNDKTREVMTKFSWVDVKVPAKITVFVDRSYELEVLPPVSSHLIMWKAWIKAGSANPNKTKVGKISRAQLRELVEYKKPVMNTENEESIINSLAWTAKSLGLEVTD